MMKLSSSLAVLGSFSICLSSQAMSMETTELDLSRKKDFLLVKNEIIQRLGKDFRRENPYINSVRLNREVAGDTSLGAISTKESPYKAASLDKMFHKKADVANYIHFKREETNAWIFYTQKFIEQIDLNQYASYPTFSNVTFPQRFHDFLAHKKQEQEKWLEWLKVARKNPNGLLLAPKRHPHEITGVEILHEMGLNGEGTEVCVWDCGFFKNRNVNYVRDVPSLLGNYEPGDDRGNAEHGTHVSGIVAARDTAGKAKGVAYGADIYPIVYNGIDQFIKEIQDSKSRVINGSFGFLLRKENVGALTRLAEELTKHDRLLVMASGNSSKYLSDPAPVNFQAYWFNGMWVGPNYPMVLTHNQELAKRLLLVGSMKEDGVTVSRFSNLPGMLPEHFIYAPGENVRSTISRNKFDRYSGTSMAAPHVTGIVALLAKSFPNLDMTEVKQVVLKTGDAFWADEGNKFDKNYDASTHGMGRINALKAFQMAQQLSASKGDRSSMMSSASTSSIFETQEQLANRVGLAHGMGRLWVNAGFNAGSSTLVDDDMMEVDQWGFQPMDIDQNPFGSNHMDMSDRMDMSN
jgi:Subtilase family